ncbi:hypothetical protein Droror1_Dr00014515 [Drosera rotundifolia]
MLFIKGFTPQKLKIQGGSMIAKFWCNRGDEPALENSIWPLDFDDCLAECFDYFRPGYIFHVYGQVIGSPLAAISPKGYIVYRQHNMNPSCSRRLFLQDEAPTAQVTDNIAWEGDDVDIAQEEGDDVAQDNDSDAL